MTPLSLPLPQVLSVVRFILDAVDMSRVFQVAVFVTRLCSGRLAPQLLTGTCRHTSLQLLTGTCRHTSLQLLQTGSAAAKGTSGRVNV